jgi:hypothetical protein
MTYLSLTHDLFNLARKSILLKMTSVTTKTSGKGVPMICDCISQGLDARVQTRGELERRAPSLLVISYAIMRRISSGRYGGAIATDWLSEVGEAES